MRVELDRLADYAAGVLDGTPEAEHVATLIATDPEWADAYAALLAAESTVLADLALLGASAEPMPADVASSIDRALADAGRRPRLEVLPGGGVPTKKSPRRRRAWLAAVAAGVVALGGFSVATLGRGLVTQSESTAGMADRGGVPEGPAGAFGQPQAVPPADLASAPPVRVASGTNYDAALLSSVRQSSWAGQRPAPAETGKTTSEADGGGLALGLVPPPLQRLAAPAPLLTCLNQVTQAYGGTPSLVDYARFETQPALVVVLVDPAGKPFRTVVVGPSCGLPTSGADVRYTVPIG